MSPAAILVDGVPSSSIPALDRGLAFGDGVFRTLAVRSGRPLNWKWHMRRLRADCDALRLLVPDEGVLRDELARVAPAEASAKVIVTRGAGQRGYAIGESRPTRVVAAFAPSAHAERARDGVRVHRCELVMAEQPRLAGAKHLNRLENVLARSEWTDPAIAEGLLGDAHGHVVEGVMSNVFVARGGRLATPSLTRCGVVGAQRERLRALLAAERVEVEVRDIAWRELEEADELFLTNSLIGVWPVVGMQARAWPVGPLARLAQRLIDDDDARD